MLTTKGFMTNEQEVKEETNDQANKDQDQVNTEKDIGDSGDRGSSRKDSPEDYGPLHPGKDDQKSGEAKK